MGHIKNRSLFSSLLPTSSLSLSSLSLLLLVQITTQVYAQSITPRWGQSQVLLSPSSKPHFLISTGHSYTPGQTLTSSPLTSSLLSLDLSFPIPDLSNPPWVDVVSQVEGPMNSWGGLIAVSEDKAWGFGGDSTGDLRVPIQTSRDSSYTLSLSINSTDQLEGLWRERSGDQGWVNQPERRELFFHTSAMSFREGLTRSWIHGGLRADGSRIGFGEVWEMRVSSKDEGMDEVEWARWVGEGGPGGQGLNDGKAVLVNDDEGGLPVIYLIGGVETSSNTLVSFNEIWTFTPSSSLGSGSWSTLSISSMNVPLGRKGHSALYLGNGKIWIGGGRSLDESEVYSDSWILDLKEKEWTRMKDLQEGVWGASSVVLGQTVLSSFGYGLNSPASTDLRVWSWSNDTWLNSYTPSYQLAVPTNPKASSPSSSSSTSSTNSSNSPNLNSGSSSTDQTETPSNPKAHSDDPSSSSSPSSSSNPDASSSSPDSKSSSPSWVNPGSPSVPPSDPNSNDPSSSSDSSDKSKDSSSRNDSPSKSLVAGAIAGSLLGALALAAVGVYGVRRRKRSSRYRAGGGRGGYGGYTGDDEGLGMVEKSGEEKPSGGFREFFSPKVGAGGVGVGLGMAGIGKRRRVSQVEGARRWDMLGDEEEEEEDQEARGGMWTRFGEEEDEGGFDRYSHLDRDREGSADSSRIGVGIWGGLGRSESVKSGTSYLGGNLGGFLSSGGGGAERERGDYAGIDLGGIKEDPTLTPIAEWEEDEDEEEDEDGDRGTMESGIVGGVSSGGTRSTETHTTRTTLSTSDHSNSLEAASIRQATRHQIVRPFSPGSTSSLYGSGFATPTAFTLPQQQGITRSTSSSSSLFLSPGQGAMRRDNSSWWSRLKHHQQASTEIPTATAFEAIRDPAPVPTFDSNSTSRDNPFSDPTNSSTDEHGRMSERAVRGVHDRSISSNVSEVTATSSILEERMRGMDVVQRMRSAQEGGSEGSSSVGGGSTQVTPTLAQNPFADPIPTPTPGSVIFAGSQYGFSPRPSSPPPPLPTRSNSNDFPLLPIIPSLLPPTPSHATPPSSPRKSRLMGPRPQPSQPLPSITRSGSVKDLVADIERRASLPHSPSILTSPTRPSSRRSRTTHEGAGRKVEHGLVKKPKLYVANP